MAKLREIILLLAEGGPLPPRYQDHPLGGQWKHYRDCHIEPDWLLIYKIDGNGLYPVRTGTRICSEGWRGGLLPSSFRSTPPRARVPTPA